MENKHKTDEEEIAMNSENNRSNISAIQQPAHQEDEPKAKCECPPGCVGLPCCT